jgi:prenyltransferase beta subunit
MSQTSIYLRSVVTLAAFFVLILANVGNAHAGDFDFAKTKAFIREMDTRPDFPVNMVLAHDYVYSLASIGDNINPKEAAAAEAFIKANQHLDGGFSSDKHDKETSILYTVHALETLALIKLPPAIDLGRARTFINSLKNADGGFGFSANAKESSLNNTYNAVRSLSLLNSVNMVDAAKTAAYVKGFEHKEGGFGYVKGTGIASAKFTYMAAYILKELGKLDEATKANALKYLNTSAYGKGTKGKVDSLQMLEEMGYTIDALKLLGASSKIDLKKANGIVKQVYVKQNGGFGPIPGYGSTPDSTFLGLRLLVGAGKLKTPVQYPLVKK